MVHANLRELDVAPRPSLSSPLEPRRFAQVRPNSLQYWRDTEGKNKKGIPRMDRGIEPDVNRTRNLLIWSQTRYHCATDPAVTCVRNCFIYY
jgi:hypothetical protein